MARSGIEMRRHLRAVLNDPALARDLADNGRRTILKRHSCKHRADELLAIVQQVSNAAPLELAMERS